MTDSIHTPAPGWVGYPPAFKESGAQRLIVSAQGLGVHITMHLPVEGYAGRQYDLDFDSPQELWDFLHQLPRETQTCLGHYFKWQKPATWGKQRDEPKASRPRIQISLEDLDL
jgi:hypothetical protein